MVRQRQCAYMAALLTNEFADDKGAMRDYLPKLFDNFSVNASTSIPGRININQAPKPLLLGIPGLDPNQVDQIIGSRDLEVTAERPDRAGSALLGQLAAEVRVLPGRPSTDGLLHPVGDTFIPPAYATKELLA